jgi:hypothetical protein
MFGGILFWKNGDDNFTIRQPLHTAFFALPTIARCPEK